MSQNPENALQRFLFMELEHERFALKQARNPHTGQRKYDTGKVLDHFASLLSLYCTGLTRLSYGVVRVFADIAKRYAANDFTQEATHSSAHLFQFARLRALIGHPLILKSGCTERLMVNLRDLSGPEPWDFEMYSPHDGVECRLLPGIDGSCIPAFDALIRNTAVWEGKAEGIDKVFFSSVADALRLLSKGPHMLPAIEARIALLERSTARGTRDKAAISPQEMEELKALALIDEDAGWVIIDIETGNGLMTT